MSENRLEILQMLADGKINAAQAAAMMNEQSIPDPAEVIHEEKPVESPKPDSVEIEIDEEFPAALQVKAAEATNSSAQSRLRIIVSGSPIKADLDISLPDGLLSFGRQLSNMVMEEADTAPHQDIDFEVAAGDQHVHIYTEQMQ